MKNKKSQPKAGPPLAEKVKSQKLRSARGFSLVEVMVAMLIFALAMTMISSSFSGFFRNFTAEKRSQNAYENAQYALNLMAKSLRTSSVALVPDVPWPLETYDYSQGECIAYNYSGNKLQIATTKDPSPASLTDCGWGSANLNTYNDLTANDIASASINATASTPTTFGKVTIALNVRESDQTVPTAAVPIQMTVSMRNNN